VVIPGCPHHVTQRGNNHQDVFFVDDDRRLFLQLLREAGQRFSLTFDGYCLMTNHVHLVCTPTLEESLARAMKRVSQLYAQYVNRFHRRSGHLWQDRFYSCALDEDHFWSALVYVERNPVRAGIARHAWDWAWSSAVAHTGGAEASGLLSARPGRGPTDPARWKALLAQPQDDEIVSRLRRCTSRGRPLGTDSFLSKLERALGRRLRPLPRGRPKTRGEDQAKK